MTWTSGELGRWVRNQGLPSLAAPAERPATIAADSRASFTVMGLLRPSLQRVPAPVDRGALQRARDLRGARPEVALVDHVLRADHERHDARRAVLRRVGDERSALPRRLQLPEQVAVDGNRVAQDLMTVGGAERTATIDGGQLVLADAPEHDLLLPVQRIEEPGAVPGRERNRKGPVLCPDVEDGTAALAADAVHFAVLGHESLAVASVLELVPAGQDLGVAAEE